MKSQLSDRTGCNVSTHASSLSWQICTPDLVVFLACTNHRLKERLQKRAEQQGRPDDNPKAIDRRLTNFKQNTIPLVKYFQERGLIVTVRLIEQLGLFVFILEKNTGTYYVNRPVSLHPMLVLGANTGSSMKQERVFVCVACPTFMPKTAVPIL